MSLSQNSIPGLTSAFFTTDESSTPDTRTVRRQVMERRQCCAPLLLVVALLASCSASAPDQQTGNPCGSEGDSFLVAFRVATKDGVILADGKVDEYETMSVLGEDDSKALGFRPDVRGSQNGKCLVDFAILVVYDPLVESREVFDSSVQLLEGESVDVKVPFEDSHVDLFLLGVRQATGAEVSESG